MLAINDIVLKFYDWATDNKTKPEEVKPRCCGGCDGYGIGDISE